MHKFLFKRDEVTAVFIMLLLTTTLVASFTPKATATPTLRISIDPPSGPVGTEVKVNGTIDTLNGSYTVRWNKTLNVATGYAVKYNVTTSFVIPKTVGAPPPGRKILVELIDNNKTVDNIVNATFILYTKFHIKAVVPSPPKQLQEGNLTDIWINVTGGEVGVIYHPNITVTDPAKKIYHNDTLWLPVKSEGYAENHTTYPTYFLPTMAHTNYTGWYDVYLNKTDNEFLGHDRFFIGLTNATEYHRFQVVNIRAANYSRPNEWAWVNITKWVNVTYGKVVFSENVSAVGGLIQASWKILGNASMGLYTVNVTSSITDGTVKPVPDIQNFTIAKIPCQIQTKKLNGIVMADVIVYVYNITMELLNASATDEEGLAKFWLEGGNYTFEAEWGEPGKRILVGTLVNESIKLEAGERIVNVTLWCWIANLRIEISPRLPFIDVTLMYLDKTSSFGTDDAGTTKAYDLPTNISYTIEGRRYGFLFFNTTMEKLPATMGATWVNITIPCPTYTLFIHALDSKGLPLKNVEVAVYEWSSGVTKPMRSETTNDWGSVAFQLTFGKYKILVYNQNRTIILNQTAVNLIEDQLFFVIHCKIFNVDLSVVVKDYFGNPIPKTLVEVEREGLAISSKKTGPEGTAPFYDIIGGDCQISVSIRGKLCETRTLYLDEAKVVVFKVDKYVMVGGYPLETVQLIAYISLIILVALFALALTYRRLRPRKVQEGEGK